MKTHAFWFSAGVGAVALVGRLVMATEVAGAHSSGFPPGTRYQPDPPYRSSSRIEALTVGPKEQTSIVLRGARALIGLFSPRPFSAKDPPRIVAADGTPLQAQSTEIAVSETSSESSNTLMTIEVPSSTPGPYRLTTLHGDAVGYSVIVLDGSAYTMDAWMSRMFYYGDQSPVVYARLYDSRTGTAVRGFRVKAWTRVSGLRSALLKDDGVLPDATADDGVYTGALVPRHVITRKQMLRFGSAVDVKVKAEGSVDRLRLRRIGMTTFDWCTGSSTIDAIGSAYLDRPNGATTITVPVTLTTTLQGHYHLEGNLVGPNDELVAWAAGEIWLQGGTETVPLTFGAGIVAAAGVTPPFSLRKVLLQEEGAEAPVAADVQENLGTVGGFTLGQLAADPTPSPDPNADEDLTGLLP